MSLCIKCGLYPQNPRKGVKTGLCCNKCPSHGPWCTMHSLHASNGHSSCASVGASPTRKVAVCSSRAPRKTEFFTGPVEVSTSRTPRKSESFDGLVEFSTSQTPRMSESFKAPVEISTSRTPRKSESFEGPVKVSTSRTSRKSESFKGPCEVLASHTPRKSESFKGLAEVSIASLLHSREESLAKQRLSHSPPVINKGRPSRAVRGQSSDRGSCDPSRTDGDEIRTDAILQHDKNSMCTGMSSSMPSGHIKPDLDGEPRRKRKTTVRARDDEGPKSETLVSDTLHTNGRVDNNPDAASHFQQNSSHSARVPNYLPSLTVRSKSSGRATCAASRINVVEAPANVDFRLGKRSVCTGMPAPLPHKHMKLDSEGERGRKRKTRLRAVDDDDSGNEADVVDAHPNNRRAKRSQQYSLKSLHTPCSAAQSSSSRVGFDKTDDVDSDDAPLTDLVVKVANVDLLADDGSIRASKFEVTPMQQNKLATDCTCQRENQSARIADSDADDGPNNEVASLASDSAAIMNDEDGVSDSRSLLPAVMYGESSIAVNNTIKQLRDLDEMQIIEAIAPPEATSQALCLYEAPKIQATEPAGDGTPFQMNAALRLLTSTEIGSIRIAFQCSDALSFESLGIHVERQPLLALEDVQPHHAKWIREFSGSGKSVNGVSQGCTALKSQPFLALENVQPQHGKLILESSGSSESGDVVSQRCSAWSLIDSWSNKLSGNSFGGRGHDIARYDFSGRRASRRSGCMKENMHFIQNHEVTAHARDPTQKLIRRSLARTKHRAIRKPLGVLTDQSITSVASDLSDDDHDV